jgi:hypothetical protein
VFWDPGIFLFLANNLHIFGGQPALAFGRGDEEKEEKTVWRNLTFFPEKSMVEMIVGERLVSAV